MRDAERQRDAGRRRRARRPPSARWRARRGRPATATTKPATRPPRVIAGSDSPATRKPTAAPGRIACAMASPVRLMRRSIRNTPTGAAAERERDRADQRAPHELELGEGRDEEVVASSTSCRAAARHRRRRRRRCARRPHAASYASTMRRALQEVLGGQHLGGRRPRRPARARCSSVCGKMRLHQVEIVQHGEHGAALRRASGARGRAGRRWSWRRWR